MKFSFRAVYQQWYRTLKRTVTTQFHSDPIERMDQRAVFSRKKKRIPAFSQLKHTALFLAPIERYALSLGIVCVAVGAVWGGWLFVKHHRVLAPAVGGTYVESVLGQPVHLTPLFASLNETDDDIVHLVYSGLMRYTTDNKLVNDLAESVIASDDHKTYTVTLLTNARFHDGVPVTADDVAFTIGLIQNDKTGSPLKNLFSSLKVQIIDARTVAITFPSTTSYFNQVMTTGIMPKHLWQDVHPEDIRGSALNSHPIGSGPFVFSGLNKNGATATSLRLTRNMNFYRTPPYISDFEFQFHSSYEDAFDTFSKKETDGFAGLTADDAASMGHVFAVNYNFTLPEYSAIFFNQVANSSLKEQAVRDALDGALDIQKIITMILKGQARNAESPLGPAFASASPASHSFDPQASADVLDSHGWKRVQVDTYLDDQVTGQLQNVIDEYKKDHNGDKPPHDVLVTEEQKLKDEIARTVDPVQTFVRKKNNDYLEVTLTFPGTKDYRSVADFVAESWRTIGIIVHLKEIPPDSLGSLTNSHHYEALLAGVVLGGNTDPYPLWYNASADASPTLARFSDPSFDALLLRIHTATDDDSRTAALAKFENYIFTNKPALMLYYPTFSYVQSTKVHGVHEGFIVSPADRFDGVTGWYIRSSFRWQW